MTPDQLNHQRTARPAWMKQEEDANLRISRGLKSLGFPVDKVQAWNLVRHGCALLRAAQAYD